MAFAIDLLESKTKVLRALQHRGDMTASELAQHTGIREENIQLTLHSLSNDASIEAAQSGGVDPRFRITSNGCLRLQPLAPGAKHIRGVPGKFDPSKPLRGEKAVLYDALTRPLAADQWANAANRQLGNVFWETVRSLQRLGIVDTEENSKPKLYRRAMILRTETTEAAKAADELFEMPDTPAPAPIPIPLPSPPPPPKENEMPKLFRLGTVGATVVDLLSDGREHKIPEIAQRTALSRNEVSKRMYTLVDTKFAVRTQAGVYKRGVYGPENVLRMAERRKPYVRRAKPNGKDRALPPATLKNQAPSGSDDLYARLESATMVLINLVSELRGRILTEDAKVRLESVGINIDKLGH